MAVPPCATVCPMAVPQCAPWHCHHVPHGSAPQQCLLHQPLWPGQHGHLAEPAETDAADCFSCMNRLICLSLQPQVKKMEKNIWKEEVRARPQLSTVPYSQHSTSCEMAGTVSAHFTAILLLWFLTEQGKWINKNLQQYFNFTPKSDTKETCCTKVLVWRTFLSQKGRILPIPPALPKPLLARQSDLVQPLCVHSSPQTPENNQSLSHNSCPSNLIICQHYSLLIRNAQNVALFKAKILIMFCKNHAPGIYMWNKNNC